MKTITKVGISAIGAAAVAGVTYLGKKIYDKTKTSEIDVTTESNEDQTVNVQESSENHIDQ